MKIKEIINNNKILFIVFLACIGLILTECIFLFAGKGEKKNYNVTSNSNSNHLTSNEQKILGINSNSNVNSLVEEKKEQKKQEKKDEKKTELYKKYEKLTEEEKSKLEVIPREEDVLYDDTIDDIKDNLDINDNVKLPVKYTLSDTQKLNFKHQKEYGLCWAFAGSRTLESFLQSRNLGTYNLSEIHTDYVMSDLMYGDRKLHSGGFFDYYVRYTHINNGVVDNSLYDYDKAYQADEYNDFIYSQKIPYVITDYVEFPNFTYSNGKFYKDNETEATEEELQDLRNTVKAHIMKNGAVSANIDSSCLYYGKVFCTWDDFVPNHAITIIGWDDNYDAKNFKEEEFRFQPKHNGAFIAINSWSTEEKYIYISYEDPIIYSDINGILSVSLDDAMDLSTLNEKQKQVIKDHMNLDIVNIGGKEYLTKASAKTVDSLNMSGYGLTSDDLSFLSFFDNLYSLDLSKNNITDLSPLVGLKNLTILSLDNNNISDLTPISQLNLGSLQLSHNKITNITPLANQKELYNLELDNNPISDVNALNKLAIEFLNLSNCNIKEFNVNNVKYLSLDLSGNEGINILGNFSTNYLKLSNIGLTDISFLNNNMFSDEAITIDLSNNDIKSIKPLLNIDNIGVLDLSGNKNIEDLSELKQIYNKEYAKEKETNDDDFVSSLVNIVQKKFNDVDNNEFYYNKLNLYLSDCNITDITLFNDYYVSSLDLSNNQITTVEGFNNEVSSLILDNNSLDLSYVNLFDLNIEELSLKNCHISDISGLSSKTTNMISLDLSDNSITDVTPLKNLNVDSLSLANNKGIVGEFPSTLSSLNVSNCDLNDGISFSNLTDLSNLNISNNPNITKISEFVTSLPEIYYIIIGDRNLGLDEYVNIFGNQFIDDFQFNGNIIVSNLNVVDNKINLLDYPDIHNLIKKRDIVSNSERIRVKNGTQEDKYFTHINVDNVENLPEITFNNGMNIKFQQN